MVVFQRITCMEQSCTFINSYCYLVNSYKSYYTCQIHDSTFIGEEPITINTARNLKSNDDVTVVSYTQRSYLDVIPNILFETFPQLTILYANAVGLTNLKPSFFKNAKNLKGLSTALNLITNLSCSF